MHFPKTAHAPTCVLTELAEIPARGLGGMMPSGRDTGKPAMFPNRAMKG